MASTPPFAAAYAVWGVADPTSATIELMLTIEPPPVSSMCGSWYFMQRKTPVRSTARIRCQTSSSVAGGSVSSASRIPALLWQTSIDPNRRRTAAYRASTAAGSVTSTGNAAAPGIPAAASSAPAASMSARATRPPSSASRPATARPMPAAAPVTTHTLSWIRPGIAAIKRERGARVLRTPLRRWR